MPPKKILRSLVVTQRAAADTVRDQWSANPFKSNDPRHEQYEVQKRTAQREAAVNRMGHALAKDLRTHDFAINGVTMGRSTTSEEYTATCKMHRSGGETARSVSSVAADGSVSERLKGQGQLVSLAPADSDATAPPPTGGKINNTGDLTAVPSKLEAPQSYVERKIPAEGLTCSAVLQGGSLILIGTRGGDIMALNGFTNEVLATVSITAPIAMCDEELEAEAKVNAKDAERRPARKAARGDAEAHSAKLLSATHGNEGRTNKQGQKEGGATVNEGAFPIAVAGLGDSSFVAFALSNKKVRVFDALTLVAVDEISFLTSEEKNNEGQAKEGQATADKTDDRLPFAAVLPVDCSYEPQVFFVACSDRIVSLNFYQPERLSDRPRLVITRIKTYEKLGLTFVSAATDTARTVVYAGDDNGDMWSVDVNDLMVVDSWPVVPPPPPPPNTKSEQRKGVAAPMISSPKRDRNGNHEVATAVGAFEEFVFAGTSGGRVVVAQRQPFGEKPLPILDEAGAHSSRIIGAAADERAMSVWFASEDGEVTCWSLTKQELMFRTRVPTEALVAGFALLPYAITNKIWTITISGINKVWVTEDHQTHDGMNVTHTQMESVLARQEMALQKKEKEVAAAETLMLGRLEKIVSTMAEQNRQRILRAYYCAWITARLKAMTRRKREDAAEALNNSAVYQLARSYYLRLVANMAKQRSKKQNEATVMLLRTQKEDELRSRYFNSLRKYVQERKAMNHRESLATALFNINSSSSLTPFYLDRWRRFSEAKRREKRHQQHLALMGRVEGKRLAFHFFMMWVRRAEEARLRKEQSKAAAIVGASADFKTMKKFFGQWRGFIAVRVAHRQRENWCDFIAKCHELALRRSAFTALQRHVQHAARLREDAAAKEAADQKAALEARYSSFAPIANKRERIKALKDQLARAQAEHSALLLDEAAISDHNDQLRVRAATAHNPILAGVTEEPRASLLRIMGRLRCATINCETDAATISKVLAKSKVDGAVLTFEGYFSDLKATVLVPAPAVPTATTRGDTNMKEASQSVRHSDPAASWPCGERAVMRAVTAAGPLQPALLQTMKALVVAFDALTAEEVAHLEAAGELLANEEAVVLLGELLHSVVARKKAAESPLQSPSKIPSKTQRR